MISHDCQNYDSKEMFAQVEKKKKKKKKRKRLCLPLIFLDKALK